MPSETQWYLEFWTRFGVKFLAGLGLVISIALTAGIVAGAAILRALGWWK